VGRPASGRVSALHVQSVPGVGHGLPAGPEMSTGPPVLCADGDVSIVEHGIAKIDEDIWCNQHILSIL